MHACRTHGKPCVNMHASGNGYKWEVIPVRGGREKQKGKEKEKGKGEKGKKERERGEERERERGRKRSRRSDGRNSSDQEVKFVYSTRAMLQEVEILHTLVYFHPKEPFVKYGNVALV